MTTDAVADGTLAVGVLGWGVIGRQVGAGLETETVAGARLAGITTRRPIAEPPAPQVEIGALVERCDVIVEAAGQPAVVESAQAILSAGCDLLISSAGALADADLRARLATTGPGRYFVTSGALGGLDLLGAALRLGPFDRVTLTSTKRGANLIQPWMDAALVARLESGESGVVCFEGSAADAATRFPQSVNIAATLAEVVDGWDLVEVRVVSGPAGAANLHVVETDGPSGTYRFEVAHAPAPDNPRSSWVVASAVLRSLAMLRPPPGSVL